MGKLSERGVGDLRENSVSSSLIRFGLVTFILQSHHGNVATKYLQDVNRGKKVEVLPDMRLRVTVRLDAVDIQATAGDAAKFATNVVIPWGDPDSDFPQCLLIHQDDFGQTENPNKSPNDPPAYIIRVYEEISATAETQVGEPAITYDQDDILEVGIDWLQFSSGTPTYGVPGTTLAPTPFSSAILKEEIRTNDGTLQRIRRNYIANGILSDVSEIRFGGKLIVRTITNIGTTPPSTPAGYTLVGPGVLHPSGRRIYTYQYANASGTGGTGGEIDRNIEYFYSPNQGTVGITRTTIKFVTDYSVVSNPITGPVGSELISLDKEDSAGYVTWTAVYSQGTGVIKTEIETREEGKLILYTLTSLNAAPSAPSPTIGGTVVLISTDVANGTRIEDGNIVYTYRWAEGKGQVDLDVRGNGDGSLIYQVTELAAAIGTPAYPGAGTAYLVDLKNEARDGYYLNVATYHKPPAMVTLKQTTQFEKPGVAIFTGSPPQLVLTPPVTLTLLADMEVSYGTSQITDDPFTVEAPASFFEAYTPTATGIPVTNTVSLGRYLAGASSINGTASYYNGVLCDIWAATLVSSTPSAFPTGSTVLHTDNEIYLVDLSGTVVYRRRKVSYTF